MTLTSSLIALLVASTFSTLWLAADYRWMFGLIVLGLFVFRIKRNLKRGHGVRQAILNLRAMTIYIVGTSVLLALVSLACLCASPTKGSEWKARMTDGSIRVVHFFEPRWGRAKGIIVYFPDANEDSTILCHSTLRPLAALGWDVIISPNGIDRNNAAGFLECANIAFPSRMRFVAGDGDGGTLAWLIATEEPEGLVTAGAGFDFLSANLDPSQGTKSPNCPFLVFHSLYDDHVSANAAIRAARKDEFETLHLKVILSTGDANYSSSDRLQWVRAVDSYFSMR
jgi:hypothetical protein